MNEKVTENNTAMVYESLQSGRGYTGYCNKAATLKFKPMSNRQNCEVREYVGSAIMKKHDNVVTLMKDSVFQYYEC